MSLPNRRVLGAVLLILLGSAPARSQIPGAGDLPAAAIVAGYVERYFDMYPTRATEAGRHDLDSLIEDFSAPRIAAWIEFNRATQAALPAAAKGASSTIAWISPW